MDLSQQYDLPLLVHVDVCWATATVLLYRKRGYTHTCKLLCFPWSHTCISRTASTKLLIFVVDTWTLMLRTAPGSASRSSPAAVLPPLNSTTRVAECAGGAT